MYFKVAEAQNGVRYKRNSLLGNHTIHKTKQRRPPLAARYHSDHLDAVMFVVGTAQSNFHGTDTSARAKATREEVERSLRDINDMRTHMEPRVQNATEQWHYQPLLKDNGVQQRLMSSLWSPSTREHQTSERKSNSKCEANYRLAPT